MEKHELLSEVTRHVSTGTLSKDELLHAYDKGRGETVQAPRALLAKILYYLGGGIVFLGIAILVRQNWFTLGSATRIITTFGSGLAAYFAGTLLSRDKRFSEVGMMFHIMGALLMPTGLFIVFREMGSTLSFHGIQSIISGILLATYFASYWTFRRTSFLVFGILYGTWFFFAFTNLLLLEGFRPVSTEFHEYRLLLVGLSYILLGYGFKEKFRQLSGWLYGFGLLGFLGAAMALGGYQPRQNMFWELIFPGLVFAVIFLSIHLKSRSFLTFGSLFLMAYILKITGEYFSQSLGWPLALVIAGLMLIAVGYSAVYVRKKYIA